MRGYRLVVAGTWLVSLLWVPRGQAAGSDPQAAKGNWPEAMLAMRLASRGGEKQQLWRQMEREYPVQMDWMLQDAGLDGEKWPDAGGGPATEKRMIAGVLGELDESGRSFQRQLAGYVEAKLGADDARWLRLYEDACRMRREMRLRPLVAKWPRIIFTKHHNMGGSHYAYTEAQSDAQAERTFIPGTALCLMELEGAEVKVRSLVADARGVIRDPDVSWDGKRILFAWKKDDRKDDYHLYEMEVGSGRIRQLTEGLGYADYEAQYLPNEEIIFNSTRCVQTVDCFTTEVSNFYAINGEGRHLRRLGFDQVHTNFPVVLNDGRVVYTRWEYNDRGQIFVQGLMQMNPDGTGQTEFYGMNSFFPTTILHARPIPDGHKLIAIASGHHSRQTGKLILIDNARGQQENSGVQLVAPLRETPAVKIDAYGQDGELFQYPYPLDERHYLVTYAPYGWSRKPPRFGIFFMDIDGWRELLVNDPENSCNQSIPLTPRNRPPARPSAVDYRKSTGTYYVQDVYAGQGLAGVPRGTIKKLRVIVLDYRAALIGSNNNGGPAGGAMIATPIAIGNGAWDAKIVLGDAAVAEDGSAFFEVPARTPLYFQALDEKGRMVQSMRSWSTLQPGENAACVGCHESKSTPPLAQRPRYAAASAPQKLNPFYGPPRGFSFKKEIQPILDRHCISCHNDRAQTLPLGTRRRDVTQSPPANAAVRSFSLLGTETEDRKAKRLWSDAYLALTQAQVDPSGREAALGHPNTLVNWIHAQSTPPVQPPYSAGSTRSRLMTLLEEGHYATKMTREELEKIACWIDLAVPYAGEYTEAVAWSDGDWQHHNRLMEKRKSQEELERKGLEQHIRERQK